MSNDIIQYAYVAGEISKKYFGRSDYENYDLGVERGQNFFTDYRGGLISRAGDEFGDFIKDDDKDVRMFEFSFSSTIANVYVLMFGDFYIRFIQDNAYVLEPDILVTAATVANPCVITTTSAHGYTVGDWIVIANMAGMTELNGRTLVVATVPSATTLTLTDTLGVTIDSTLFSIYTTGGTVSKIYTLSSPYAAADLRALKKDQLRDTIRLTHNDYEVHNLVRITATNWVLSTENFENTLSRPTFALSTASASGNAGTVYGVTAIGFDNQESLLSDKFLIRNIVNFPAVVGSVTLRWTRVQDAAFYKVYRSIVLPDLTSGNVDIDAGMELGFIGSTFSNEFTDQNIVPDFALTPPKGNNPFANGAVEYITITATGSGYISAPTPTITVGTGFRGYTIINTAGQVIAVIVEEGGKDYTDASVVSFSGGSGSGATATANRTPLTGNYPAVSTVHQQRQLYGSTLNEFLTIFGSHTDQFNNFDTSSVVLDDDAYEHTIDADTVMGITHMLPTRGGLIVFAEKTIWQLAGANNAVITPSDAQADPQSFAGSALLDPIKIDTDILYLENKNSTVRLLSYSDFSKLYKGEDRSLLANHLFTEQTAITAWTYADTPHKFVQAVRSDGTKLYFTIVKEQNVFAWTPATTRGKYTDVLAIEENGTDSVYSIVERDINGTTRKYFERERSREFPTVDDIWCLDSALSLAHTYPTATLIAAAAEGTSVAFTASTAVFSSGDVNKIIRMGGGKAVVTTYVSTTEVVCRILRKIKKIKFERVSEIPDIALPGEWTFDAPVSSVAGLHHLEGETVCALLDGNVVEDLIVTDGVVTFPPTVVATNVVIGLPFTCILKTLPPTAANSTIEGRRKRGTGIAIRVDQSRGISTGTQLDNLYDIKDRANEILGEATYMRDGIELAIIDGGFEDEGQVYIVQAHPLPANILGHVERIVVGDDEN